MTLTINYLFITFHQKKTYFLVNVDQNVDNVDKNVDIVDIVDINGK